MTLEGRISRAERILKVFARQGRKYRNEFREKIDILIHMQMRDNEEYRARQRKLDEKISILTGAHISTEEQRKETDKRIEALSAKVYEGLDRLDRLVVSQAKTDEAIDRYLDGLSEERNGNSTD